MSKRTIADLLNDEDDPTSSGKIRYTKPRLADLLSPVSEEPALTSKIPPPEQKLSFPPTTSTSPVKPTPFQQPVPLLTFSYTPSHSLEFTDSGLRYFVQPPQNAQLSYGYERWIRRPDEKGRVDSLVRAWDRACKGVDGAELQRIDIGVVAWRGVMTRILTSPYEERDGWELNVMYVNGTMYFEEQLSEAKLKEKNNLEPRRQRQAYFGYAFESYCTSPTPVQQDTNSDVPGWGGDVNTNVQWCCVVKTKLGGTRMVLGGEVDCVRDHYSGRTDSFVELKTSLVIRGPQDKEKFEKKLLKFYFQSFLLGVPEILVGFRTPSGEITTVESFKTIHIPRLVRGKPGAWDPLLCLDWGNQFLTFLKNTIRGSTAHHHGQVWRVTFTPREGASVSLLDKAGVEDVEAGEDRVGFLPRWYWDELHKDRAGHVGGISPTRSGWQI